jgi:PmbA protein
LKGLYFGDTKARIITSNNIDAVSRGTIINLSDRIFTAKDASCHKICAARVLGDFKPKKVVMEGAHMAKLAQKPHPGIRGKFDVLFDPLAFANLADEVMLSASSSAAEAGYSFLKDKLGQRVANPNVTFYDDETLSGGLNSRPFDQEGYPSQKTLVIDKGILNTYLHNTSTAWKYAAETTGNAGLVSPEPSNVVLAPGKYNLDGLASKIKKGLYISNLWYTRFSNYEQGEFSTIPRDAIFYIENGKIKHPVKQIRISDNMLRILNNVVAVGKHPQNIIGWEVEVPVSTPHVLVKDVNISKSVSMNVKRAPD